MLRGEKRDYRTQRGQLNDIIDDFEEFGRLDLSSFGEFERHKLFLEYKGNISDLPKELQSQMLEQFLAFKTCADNEACGVLLELDDEQKKVIGEYIAKTLEDDFYLEAFYVCQSFMSYVVKDGFAKAVKDGRERNRWTMVVPFAHVSEYDKKVKDKYLATESKITKGADIKEVLKYEDKQTEQINVVDRFSNVKKVLDIIVYSKNNPDNVMDVLDNYFIRDFVTALKDKNPTFLYPYLPSLVELGLLQQSEVDELLPNSQSRSWGKTGYNNQVERNFRTIQEDVEISQIEKRVRGLQGLDGIENKFLFSEDFPIKEMKRYDELNNQSRIRAVRHFLGDFEKVGKNLSKEDRLAYLNELQLERGFSVLAAADLLDLTEVEIKILLNHLVDYGNSIVNSTDPSILKILFDHAEDKGFKDSIQDLVLKQISNYFEQHGWDVFSTRYIFIAIEKFLPLFNKKKQDDLIGLLTKQAPRFWVYNPDFATQNEIVGLEEIVDDIIVNDDYLVDNYGRLLHELGQMPDQNKKSKLITKAKAKVRDIFLSDAKNFFDNLGTARQVFDNKEIEGMVLGFIEKDNPDIEFLAQIINKANGEYKYSSFFKKYFGDIRQLLIQRPDVFIALGEDDYFVIISDLKGVFKGSELEGLFYRLLPKIVKQEAFSDGNAGEYTSLLNFLMEGKEGPDRLYNELSRSSGVGELWATFYECLGPKLSKKDDSQRKNRPDLKKRTDKVKQIEYIKARERVGAKIQEQCRQDPSYVFTVINLIDSKEVKKLGLTEYIDSQAEQYLKHRPDKIALVLSNVSPSVKKRLLKKYQKTIAFKSFDFVYYAGKELFNDEEKKDIRAINPVAELNSQGKVLENDYYLTLIECTKGYRYFGMVLPGLKKIADREMEKFGRQVDIDSVYEDAEFVKMIRHISLLEASPIAIEKYDVIANTNPKIRAEILGICEILSLYSADSGIDTTDLPDEPEALRGKLASYLLGLTVRMFGIENEIESVENVKLDTELLNVLFTYFSNCGKSKAMKESIRQFFLKTITGQYESWQKWGEDTGVDSQEKKLAALAKMKAEGLLPQNLTLEQYEIWSEVNDVSFEEVMGVTQADMQKSVKSIFEQAVLDDHMEESDMNLSFEQNLLSHDLLWQPLKDIAAELKAIEVRHPGIKSGRKAKKAGIQQEILDTYHLLKEEKKAYLESNQEKIDQKKAWLYLSYFKNVKLEDIEKNQIKIGKKLVSFMYLFGGGGKPGLFEKVFSNKPVFLQDISRLYRTLVEYKHKLHGENRFIKTKMSITDKVDPLVHMKIGAEPVVSCQNFDSSSTFNYGLLAYATDPNVRILKIYGADGRIVARSVLRMLRDKKDFPTLFLERVYAFQQHKKIDEAIVKFAKSKAKQMGVKVYTSPGEFSDFVRSKSDVGLKSTGSRAPFVYTDAGGGKRKNGKFMINRSCEL
jgi:hypothetical protein